jgi:hypothetical protein
MHYSFITSIYGRVYQRRSRFLEQAPSDKAQLTLRIGAAVYVGRHCAIDLGEFFRPGMPLSL